MKIEGKDVEEISGVSVALCRRRRNNIEINNKY